MEEITESIQHIGLFYCAIVCVLNLCNSLFQVNFIYSVDIYNV